ncbi:MAG: N-acetylmuramoyl-L-alanine amidase [bacterium]
MNRTGPVKLIVSMGLFILLLRPLPISAETVIIGGKTLAKPYIVQDGHIYISLDDLLVPLGISSISDGNRLLIGNTINGTLTVDPSSTTVKTPSGTEDYCYPFIKSENAWYAPVEFPDRALGVRAKLREDTKELLLYPEVVAITHCASEVKIDSSLKPDFKTFELGEPPRRVIDISDTYLRGSFLSVPGSELGINGLAAIRASQFSDDPPVVRVVFEWDKGTVPKHILSPDSHSVKITIGSVQTPQANTGVNLLSGGGMETGTKGIDGDKIDHGKETNPPDDGLKNADGDGADAKLTHTDKMPADFKFQTADDFTEEAENYTLQQLKWDIKFDMNSEGEITASLKTPRFQALNEFTLASENGMRLVLDIIGTYLPGRERTLAGLGDITQVRFGQFQPSISRMVFDLGKVVAYKIEYDNLAGIIKVRIFKGDLTGKRIVIDPGHGGEDPGAVVSGVMEKDLNLSMAFALKQFLESHGAKVTLTRERDVYVTLADRLYIAEQSKADLFICLHNNATETQTMLQGVIILYRDLRFMPLYKLAHRGIAARTGVPGLGPVNDERGLYILRHAGDMPVLFIEGAFMTNQIELARLTDSSGAYERNIMMGVMDGVLAYYAGRDLPPVMYPEKPNDINVGIFDLAGKSVTVSPDAPDNPDSGSAWDTPEQASDENSTDAKDSSKDDEKKDEEDKAEHRRGRGAFRFK